MDQVQQCIQRANDVTRTLWASGQPADTAAYVQRAAGGSHGPILKLFCHVKNTTPSIDAYLLQEQSGWGLR